MARKTQVTVYLGDAETTALDLRAAKARLSRSAYVSRLIKMDLDDMMSRVDGSLAQVAEDGQRTAMMLRILLEAADPQALKQIDAEMDAKHGLGTAKSLGKR
jgi:hypothetical protein